jgi:Protein of unknown function (DUF3616)
MQAGTIEHMVLNYTAIADRMLKARKRDTGKDPSRIANISGLAPVADDLWTASDEEASIERLMRDGLGYSHAQNWDLADLFPAFAAARAKAKLKGTAGKGSEADLEGLAFDADKRRLWLVGSHCRGRGNTTDAEPKELRKSFAPNKRAAPLRTLLGFVPIAETGEPVNGTGLALPFGDGRGSLRAAVKAEGGQLSRALAWPSKENGFDIEGIAVKDTEVLLGLRGPAIAGYAVVLNVSVKIGVEALSLRRVKGARYGLTFLDLNGLGVRDLFRHGDDVLVLAGPTMDLDAPFALYRWTDAFAPRRKRDATLKVDGKQLQFLFDFTPRARHMKDVVVPVPIERPEGIAVVGRGALLVVHDRPADARLKPSGILKADLLNLARSAKLRRPQS